MKRISKLLHIPAILSAIVGLFSLSACTAEDISVREPEPDNTGNTSGEGFFHMAFRMKMASDGPTRAAEGFVDGTENEHKVEKLMFLFFNKDGEQLYSATSSNITDLEHDNDSDDIEYEFNTLAAVSLGDDQSKFDEEKEKIQSIESFFLIVNYDSDWKFTNGTSKMTLEEVKTFTADKYKVDDNFVMTTAGRYDNNGNYFYYQERGLDDDGEKVQWFFETKNAAKDNPVTTYVERVAARVDMTIVEDITGIPVFYGENQFGTDIYELTFKPLSWGITAKGKETYLAKNLKDNKSGSEEYTTAKGYDETGFYNWIHQSGYYHRVFWSESKYFNDGSYTKDGTETEADEKNLSLKYIRYSALDPENTKFDKDKSFVDSDETDDTGHKVKVGSKSEYLMERTFAADLLKNAENPNAIATSIIVYGTYSAELLYSDKVNSDGTKPEPSTSEIDIEANGFYLRDVAMERVDEEVKYRLYLPENSNGENDLYNALLNEQYTIFKAIKNDDGSIAKYEPVRAEDNLAIFEIRNTYLYWNGSTFVPSPNQYTLQLKTDWASNLNGETLYYGKYAAGETDHHTMVQLTQSNYAEANKTIQETIGAAQFYYKAHAFFYSPIPHYSLSYSENSPQRYDGTIHYKKETDGSLTKTSDGKYIPDHNTGDLGVVRNHIYNIKVYKFSTLGYGQPDGDNLVLPEPRVGREQEQFDIKLEILPWNEFNYTFDL